MNGKSEWCGSLRSVQPRIRLTRSFDERSHTYQGYVLQAFGSIDGDNRGFVAAIGKAAHQKHRFEVGDVVSGEGAPVADPRLETAELYRVSKLRILSRRKESAPEPPPWHGVPPELDVYRGTRPSPACWSDIRHELFVLYLGMPNGGGDDHRPPPPAHPDYAPAGRTANLTSIRARSDDSDDLVLGWRSKVH
jgi:hypothetical protein